MSIEAVTEAADGPRSKRPAILVAAMERFGEVGYEAIKWSEVADRVGIGQTALYHYFESKAHCLLTIMRLALRNSDAAFRKGVEGTGDSLSALRAAVRAAYALSPGEVQQNRILQSNIAILANERTSEREENERQLCRELVSRIERNWTELLEEGMRRGEFAEQDARLTARNMLGLIVGVWRWYRPDGALTLDVIAESVENACVLIATGGKPRKSTPRKKRS
ncbi:TetR/AcrR family transcriptional regulator [Amycolatopsis acidicola]|uniref:TetR/AcrR family transcriptional regulator n=1 Tax=Amycolatopsis acidicola TaxID=2596893 RepID=A0A5N0ULX6_9PSEU|nr:TetR/AcrR family transcriptional regulator [Amycolatopsis acidicola]KAA9151009.1 TetR/AcrR family transcriptional regulator [Amycolatopsis acidicola]